MRSFFQNLKISFLYPLPNLIKTFLKFIQNLWFLLCANSFRDYSLILDYINDHLSDATEDSIAKGIGMSKFALSRLFNQNMGCNLRTYISSIRINTARRMLIQTNLPVSEIASRCNYSSTRSFNRDFLRFCGVQPREYRNLEKSQKMVNYQNPLATEIFLKKWSSPAFSDYPPENVFSLSPASQPSTSRTLQA